MIVLLVLLGIALSEMATDIYVPALPFIHDSLGVEKSLVQMTLSINLIGIAISSLLYGFLSDCYGRRNIFLVGVIIFTIASFLCYITNDIVYLIAIRFVQGFGGGVAGVVGQASLKDLYSGTKHAQILSRVGMVTALSPAIGPIVGGMIISEFDWHVVFLVLFAMGVILTIMLFCFFKETLPSSQREKFHIAKIFTSYYVVFTNRTFLVMCIIEGIMLMWLWNEIANLPFVFIGVMKMKASHYGYFVAVNVLSYILGTIINHRLLPKLGVDNLLRIGIIMCIIPDCILLLIRSLVVLDPIIITLVWIPSLIGLAFVVSNSMSIALNSVPQKAVARASACLAFGQMACGSLGIYVVSVLFNVNSIVPISYTNIVCSASALLIYTYIYKQKAEKQPTSVL